jgi:RHS repeat-associated protein
MAQTKIPGQFRVPRTPVLRVRVKFMQNPHEICKALAAHEIDPQAAQSYYRARYYDQNVGRFLGEDPSGFNDGVNFYRYVHNDPIDNTDPLGLTTYKGFPADKEADLRNAVNEALKRLRETCDGPSCAGKDGKKIANIIEDATFVYQAKSKLCGHTGPVTFLQLRHTFALGPAAFTPSCCSLASTLVHEVVHGMTHLSDKKPDQVEKDCFGCTVPE